MNRNHTRILASSCVLLMAFSARTFSVSINDGIFAYARGDYETAYNVMISLADSTDDGIAHYYLGTMYLQGQGVEQDHAEAGKRLRAASQQGLAAAMYKLAGLYAEGKGVPKDIEFAYIWYSVGAAHQHQASMDSVEQARAKLSEEELQAADGLIAEYITKYGPKVDGRGADGGGADGGGAVPAR